MPGLTRLVSPGDLGFGRLFLTIRDAVVVAEVSTGRIALWNPAAEQLFGYSAAEAVGLPLETLVPDRLKARHRAGFARYRESGRGRLIQAGRPIELPALRRDGSELTVELTLSPIEDVPGGGRYILGIVRDVSDRVAEERVAQHLATIVQSSHVPIYGKTLDGVITSWNAGAERLYGYSAAEVVGKSVALLVPPERSDELPGLLARLRRGEQIEQYETERVRKDGRRVEVSLSISPVRDMRGEIAGAAAITHDISERKRAEEQRLQLAREQTARAEAEAASERLRRLQAVTEAALTHLALDDLLDALLDRVRGVLAVDVAALLLREDDQLAVRATRGLEEDLEHRVRIPLAGGLFAQRIAAERRPLAMEDIDQAEVRPALRAKAIKSLLGAPLLVEGEVLGVLHVGTLRRRRFCAEETQLLQLMADRAAQALERARLYEAERQARQEAEALAGNLTAERNRLQAEVTARKLSEEALARQARALARSNAELERFAYVASHDLQEPLRAVVSYLQLLERRYQGRLDERAHKYIAHAVEGGRRMQQLVADLLAYSRAGRQGGGLAITDCEVILRRVLANLRAAIEESGAQVTHDPLPTVRADAAQLAQLFQNLVGNALKFRGPNPPRVHVWAERREPPGEWRFAVRDNGIGIAPEFQERIFGLFQRLHGRREYPGTGLGLAICKKIVEGYGGRLWVQSEPGQGSTFYFTLPDEAGAAP